ncbi:MAG TPA: hypothetical protein VMB49_09860, partial [Acidobacteriaceae bacterium]|nr:hypothetical protein [Acidobacteriaceae bacterium]
LAGRPNQGLGCAKAAARHTSRRSQVRWRSILTSTEVALSPVLLVGAWLLLKSFVRLVGVDLGFQPERVLAEHQPAEAALSHARIALQFFQQMEERVRALPGVQAVAYANHVVND